VSAQDVKAQVDVQNVCSADENLRTALKPVLQRGARELGISIEEDNFTYASREDMIIANAVAKGVDNLSPEELSNGADVGLVFLQRKERGICRFSPLTGIEEEQAQEQVLPSTLLPSGFYISRLFVTQGDTTIGQLIDQNGRVFTVPTVARRTPRVSRAVSCEVIEDPLVCWIIVRGPTTPDDFPFGCTVCTLSAR
jgi:hypothetical protein